MRLCFLSAALVIALAVPAQALPRHDMVEAADPRAAAIGRDILRQGGSAADAAAAMAVALTIVEPQAAGLGGGGFFVYYDAKNHTLSAIDGRETAPKAARPDRFLDASGEPLPFVKAMVGGRAIGVPGMLAMLAEAHRHFGHLRWAALIAPSIGLAENGFALSPRVHALLARDRFLRQSAAAAALYYENGAAKPAGAVIVNPALAKALKLVAADGANVFYRGTIASDIAAAVAKADPPGDLTAADLASYEPIERPVLCHDYRHQRVCGMGLPSGEATVLEILGLLQHFDLRAHVADAQAWHLFAAASKLAYADRTRWLGDPRFVDAPVAGLLASAYLAGRARQIDHAHETPGPAAPGDPAGRHAANWGDSMAPEFPSTSTIAVIDRDGNAVAMTVTIEAEFGSHVMVDGFLLDNELTDFSFVPEVDGRPVANRVQASKRPLSAMSPSMMFDPEGRLRLVVGSAGGPAIITDVAKTIVAIVDWHDGLKAAIARPNVGNRNGPTEIEAGPDAPALAAALERMGHVVRISRRASGLGGILVTPEGYEGASDPRREGAALGD
ncbi:MAG: gamma-glutamyltransferase [Stellaceae bacterium]